ncbi:diguanylate cyclase [Notoacmeibacter sp. MSK16QG-6]|uniref:GGDEF domain-containing protein n=1 Tax=Notoacmeibacter sp. MSK16QG-6 TaxID=2957982 RepID=UPI0020A060E2|nr:diguanylate cyclase [Notoacmeibacter sp. MSK16QG-6]MCP1198572.1 diguanylate cyclase [Notoacmeibacter sp. MSK16QG-6]
MHNANITDAKNRGSIVIFDEGASLSQISAVVGELRFTPIDGFSDLPFEDDAFQPHLAIVNDGVKHAMARWQETARHLPTIKITDDNAFGARLQAARQGVAGIVHAPLSSDELTSWVRHFSTLQHARQSHVLIVDDDFMTQEVSAQALRQADMTVTVVESAQQAFSFLQADSVDAVLLDLQMPDVDGIEFARIIRQDQENLSLPIIFLSGERDPNRQLQARRLGGDDFILKPVSPSRLCEVVEMRLQRAGALKSLIERDSLTGLLNHGRFHAQLENEIERSHRTKAKVSVALIDLDHFKSVNDTYGHQVGDRVIRSLATLLSTSLRKTDLIGRLGGEEFGVILLDTDAEAAAQVIDRLRETFEETEFDVEQGAFSVSFSAGISDFGAGMAAADLVRLADSALYQAKARGRGRTVTDATDWSTAHLKATA